VVLHERENWRREGNTKTLIEQEERRLKKKRRRKRRRKREEEKEELNQLRPRS